ncbi:vesicle-associated membrane protein-associated protein B isoform X1 [Zootermopsis nevadensis]|uniref:vesicle-associated membrane protein-associated protein B isoform X1 n=2 Tax=Zootermopsis nevadensis TaxID=136037 RepID=UPI000B8E61CE|nr:vesicle-associated membrane protein-associated protein B isoform X1 [Zootermopsis nevadensis]
MAKQEQVLIIEPQHELKFRGPFTSPVTSYMKLTNPSEKKVCFKIKTTAPKKYCVRPNSGVLDAKGIIDVAVSLQPFDFDPNEKSKHKFMVQTMIAPDGEISMDSLWKDVNPDNLMDSKLKCVFEMPVDPATTGPQENNVDVSPAVHEEKAKRIGDGVKASPKPNSTVEGELLKAAAEVKHLREEESSLRQENLQLKEEILRLRRSPAVAALDSTAPILASGTAVTTASLPMMYVVLALFMGLVGIILGKFLL